MSDARDIQHGVNQRSRRRRRREAQVPGQQDAVRTRAKSCRRPRRRFTRAGRRILARKAPTAAHRTAQQAERAKPDTPIVRHGDSGHGYRTSFALAEWLCRTVDRIDPAREFESRHRFGRGTSAPNSEKLCGPNCDSVRMHRSLQKDAPVSRPLQRSGAIILFAILGGLYVRIKFSVQTPHRR